MVEVAVDADSVVLGSGGGGVAGGWILEAVVL